MKQELNDLFKIFRQHGKQLFIVGGAVRDMLLGGYPEDYDLSTDALPEEMEAWFEHVITIGKHFGTIGVVLGEAV
ncbi:MAG: polynucleotide adenylyltransferase, partial [Eubacterium sp.]